MERVVETLPAEPIEQEDVMALSEHEAFEWGAAPTTTAEGDVYIFLLISPEKAYGLGFDESAAQWVVIHTVTRGTEGGVAELHDAIEEWAKDLYPERHSDIAPELPDV